jgi:hypothetical protein
MAREGLIERLDGQGMECDEAFGSRSLRGMWLEEVFAGREGRGMRRGEGFARLGGGGMGLAELVGLFDN